ncbi:MAG: DUF5680 domain-containing protein [Halanaerobiales bacterium]
MNKRVNEFLIKAKKETYAGKGPEVESLRPNSHDLIYEENDLKYIDTYLGGIKFAGEEALWQDNKPFWAMNYYGRVLDESFEGDFLKEVLSNVPVDMPYRGPESYQKDEFTYTCKVDGDFDWFIGYEKIYKADKKIYECRFHGGAIK